MSGEKKPTNHIIGHARTIQTAVLACEYLRARHRSTRGIHPDMISYRFKEPTEQNGFWSADIMVVMYSELPLDMAGRLVDECRAFIAGRGEIWA